MSGVADPTLDHLLTAVDGALIVPPRQTPPNTLHSSRPLSARDLSFPSPFEEVFAEMLDFYDVAWEYEPHFFVFEFDSDGRPSAGFRPDFYIPDLGCYFELTTGSPRIINLKNRRLRRLSETHPDVEVRLWKARDYVAVVNRLGLEDSLGVSPPRHPASPPVRLTGTGTSTQKQCWGPSKGLQRR